MKKRLLSAILAGAVLALAIAGCGNSADSSNNTSSASGEASAETSDTSDSDEYKFGRIDIPALDGSLCGAPIYIAFENGYFAEAGIDANLTAADFETRKIGLNNGNVPFVNGDFQFFSSIEQGINATVVGGMHFGCIKLVVRNDSDLTKPVKDLKIGVDEVGGTTYQVASVWLENGGVSAKSEDGEATFLPYSDGNLELQALYDGDIDVAAVWDPLGDIAVSSGNAKILVDISKDEPFAGKFCCFYYASKKVLEENPELIEALYGAVLKAQEWINENPEDALSIIVKGGYSEVEDEELAKQLLADYDYVTADTVKDHDVKADVEYFAQQLNNIGYLSTDAAEFANNVYSDLTE